MVKENLFISDKEKAFVDAFAAYNKKFADSYFSCFNIVDAKKCKEVFDCQLGEEYNRFLSAFVSLDEIKFDWVLNDVSVLGIESYDMTVCGQSLATISLPFPVRDFSDNVFQLFSARPACWLLKFHNDCFNQYFKRKVGVEMVSVDKRTSRFLVLDEVVSLAQKESELFVLKELKCFSDKNKVSG